MRKIDNKLIYSPSDLITYMDSIFDSWIERYHLEFPHEFELDEIDESVAILQKHGNAHELAFLQQLKDQGRDIVEIEGKDEAAELATIAAMQAGREIIYQGVLAAGEFAGRSDFLFKVPGRSKLGEFHYEVWDTKLSKKAKPYFVVQLCCYAEMLERIQDRSPTSLKIVLGDLSEKDFRTQDYIHFYRNLKESFLQFHIAWSKENPPDDLVAGGFSRWKNVSDAMLEKRDDLTRVANIRKSQIQKLKKAGINTMSMLSACDSNLPNINVQILETLRDQAQLQMRTEKENKVAFKVLPSEQGRGLSLLPPASPNDLFFDMEGYPHIEGGLEYLFGVVLQSGSGLEFKDWWAHDREQEKQTFENFVDWIYSAWLKDPSLHIYHYAPYEVSAVRRLAGRHSTRVDEVDSLLRNEVFVDLYQIVRQALLVGEESYSIKYIEKLYRPKRTGTVAKATDSVVFYERWLEDPDGTDWQSSTILKQIRDYNEEDCVSTQQLCDWLRDRQQEKSISYTGKIAVPPKDVVATPASVLALQLFQEAKSISDPEMQRVQELIASLLEFHKREDKPIWWRMYDRQKMSVDELYEDLDCLAGLHRTKKSPYKVKKSTAYEYSFDPDQDTKLTERQDCLLLHNFSSVSISALDRKNGLVTIIAGPSQEVPPDDICLIPSEYVGSQTIASSIFAVASAWHDCGRLPPALSDLFFRREPRLRERAPGEPIVSALDVANVSDAISRMQQTTLCIQGPPGCGKTYMASHTIVELIRQGKRVGISSNSHKAIEHLLEKVAEEAHGASVPLRAVKINGTPPEANQGYRKYGVEHVKDRARFFQKEDRESYDVVAGTAWAFSHDQAAGFLDYLFIDEAGQVCLANLVGMSRSTDNIILLGDQMQLEQPVQGSHPGESGMSCLEYFLQDQPTVPDHLGIFLGVSRRMHPDVCNVISSAVYQSRIVPDADNAKQTLIVPAAIEDRLARLAGVVWLPVEHRGNSQSSVEEADVIQSLVTDLLQCQYVDKDGITHPVTLEDILIVTPYNAQVRKIAGQIDGAVVASVDKFQGREAPVVILSMCASEASSSPRGLDFLFNMSRLNVAISRAKTLAFVVGSPNLLNTRCTTLKQMRLLNFFHQIVTAGTGKTATNGQTRLPIISA